MQRSCDPLCISRVIVLSLVVHERSVFHVKCVDLSVNSARLTAVLIVGPRAVSSVLAAFVSVCRLMSHLFALAYLFRVGILCYDLPLRSYNTPYSCKATPPIYSDMAQSTNHNTVSVLTTCLARSYPNGKMRTPNNNQWTRERKSISSGLRHICTEENANSQ